MPFGSTRLKALKQFNHSISRFEHIENSVTHQVLSKCLLNNKMSFLTKDNLLLFKSVLVTFTRTFSISCSSFPFLSFSFFARAGGGVCVYGVVPQEKKLLI